ncbi:MAG: pantoate--beta-alanine ligase [Candidatus Cloacimonetes bacterium]|nr:pantoate--beta-alanine ligase [Candidatus Cloacimonadota bacterium]
MGYLHEGHLSLVTASKANCDITVASIFVNPAQFGPNEDLASYPRDLDRDLDLLEAEGVDYVFFPTTEMMYPEGYLTWVEVQRMGDILCGASRPGHFRGVCTVVLKLINIVRPHFMFMGEKDFQQLSILRKMVLDLNLELEIVGCPIIREADGLAKSSRNVYLDPEQRKQAAKIHKALELAQSMFRDGVTRADAVILEVARHLEAEGLRIDYVSIVDTEDLQMQTELNSRSRMLIAVHVGKTRLIDNMLLV